MMGSIVLYAIETMFAADVQKINVAYVEAAIAAIVDLMNMNVVLKRKRIE